ncbi:peptidoglycan DD-metalloendopeptidase family protein [Rhodopseudomonas sp. P2A-2r]|uniref:peptidoglycan DD-metalloendopeptidase family protein n=1 Tax=Rhodopseudomonas sp. P2A-2r TaxID=2991972 RepID=UPI002234BE8F|nr:peptidoglycan DD-metalloendopeptidase family protein [Rhodopseudomonas sp. P2A-2r]UZE47116.1 peptidoglycan DD-metalloendopeptidase family protein [Rhodopseudomonas sp. P2A-2r]
MSSVVELLCSRRAPQAAVLALMSIGFAGCSADMQTRLSQAPSFDSGQSRGFGWQGEATGSVPRSAPTAPVQRSELPQYQRPQYQPQPQYQSQALPPPIAAPQSYPTGRPMAAATTAAPVSGGGRGLASYTPPTHAPIETTGTVAPKSIAATNGLARDGGTRIIVGTSDTLETLSRRYNVSSAAILQANGYKGPRALSPGQQLIIPRQTAVAAPAPLVVPAAKPVAMAAPVAGPASVHVVNNGDTLNSIARRNHIPVADLARANGLDTKAQLKIGSRVTVPSARAAVAAAPVAAQPVVAAAPAGAVATAPATKLASAEPAQKARMAVATTTPEEAAPETPAKAADATGALPTFRWPVRGRVVTGYGAKTNGKSNDGINVAVPEGTPIKAAEDGVVAYSGNELKGYGNLVLVRHSNGYVTAYAHASELMVKRGETIKRGQVIAKSGQSGEVGSPQLHFEIRKGSSPVDPLQFLNGA